MKRSVPFLLIILLSFTVQAQSLLNHPESAVFDPDRGHYLISNAGDGLIIMFDPADSSQSFFSLELIDNFTLGLNLHAGKLYVAISQGDMAGVAALDPATGGLTAHYAIPEAARLNDIAFDSTGMLYVTDYPGSRLFRINPEDSSYSLLYDQLDYPNGIVYDSTNHCVLFVCNNAEGRPIRAFNISDSTLTDFFMTGLSGMDGIQFDENRNLYISSWGPDAVFRLDFPYDGECYRFSSGHNDPADIYLDSFNQKIVVPNYSSHTVDFVDVTEVSVESGSKKTLPLKETILSCYPNPFNGTLTIRYTETNNPPSEIRIVDVLGRSIGGVIEEVAAGNWEWQTHVTGNNPLASGIYFVVVENVLGKTYTNSVFLLK
ncbi:SMP-30/gluconolactonase/LRE family protein [bacterium]|nr:SMP-30/gluconolactonase/LRE family protein [bacterium]